MTTIAILGSGNIVWALTGKLLDADAKKSEKSKKRRVYAPQAQRSSGPPAVISVELDEDEDVK